MSWIKTQEGYIRQDAIIDVHISRYYPQTIFFRLSCGDVVKFYDFKTPEAAQTALEKVVNELDELDSE
jgi:hypothetical protein